MVSPFEPPGERDLPGGEAAGPPSDAFVTRLRSGERDAFVRFFETYRLPVFALVRCLVPADEAAAVTTEAFVSAYRQMLLDDGAIDLEPRLYRAALAACRDHAAPAGPRGEALAVGAIALSDDTDLGRRFGQALRTVDDRLAVALLLHDVHGQRPPALAQVLGLSVDAAKALLFKAREAFLAAFEATEPARPAACRLAEQVAAGAVGRPAADSDEAHRLHEHASYCRACRTVTRSWPPGAVGLALVAARVALPAALQVPPVFVPVAGGRRQAAGARSAVAGGALSTVTLLATRVGRALASRAAAYAVAAACLVAVAGMAAYVSQLDLQPASQPLLPSAAASHSPTAQAGTPTGRTSTGTQRVATVQTASRATTARTVAVVRTVSVVGTGSSATGSGSSASGGRSSTGSGKSGGSGTGGGSGGGSSGSGFGGGPGPGGSALGGSQSSSGTHADGGSSFSLHPTPAAQPSHSRGGLSRAGRSGSSAQHGSRAGSVGGHGSRHTARHAGTRRVAARHTSRHEARHTSRHEARAGWKHGSTSHGRWLARSHRGGLHTSRPSRSARATAGHRGAAIGRARSAGSRGVRHGSRHGRTRSSWRSRERHWS